MARIRRRTKAKYMRLFDNPRSLFPGVDVTLWPNGEPTIWFQSADGLRGFSIRVSDGPAGLRLEMSKFVGTPEISNQTPDDSDYIELVQYKPDDRSQAFRRWYRDPENNPYPGDDGEVGR